MSFKPCGPVVLDSSVIIKWFRKYEPLQEQAFELRRAYLDGGQGCSVFQKRPLEVTASVCHSRESGNPCLSASLMDSRFRGNDRKLNSPGMVVFSYTFQTFSSMK